ncbi:MAG: glycosyltransferase family 9 protein, partial [Bdellovibrionales bacterium]
MAEIDCRHFNGYKPCAKNETCDRTRCSHFESVRQRVLIVHLEALGAVLRSTALIPAIKRKYPKSTITWVTKAPADQLLMGLPDVDRVLTTDASGLLSLSALQFDVGLVVDKSLQAAGVLSHTKVERVFGFRTNSFGAIVPANGEALELWNLGLNDQKKFFENKKSEAQLVHEALNLGEYRRDQYQVNLSVSEMAESFRRREK